MRKSRRLSRTSSVSALLRSPRTLESLASALTSRLRLPLAQSPLHLRRLPPRPLLSSPPRPLLDSLRLLSPPPLPLLSSLAPSLAPPSPSVALPTPFPRSVSPPRPLELLVPTPPSPLLSFPLLPRQLRLRRTRLPPTRSLLAHLASLRFPTQRALAPVLLLLQASSLAPPLP